MAQLPYDAEQEDVVLTQEFVCGKCGISMKKIAEAKFQCSKCGYTYVDNT